LANPKNLPKEAPQQKEKQSALYTFNEKAKKHSTRKKNGNP